MRDTIVTLPPELADGVQILIRDGDGDTPDIDVRYRYGVWTPIDMFEGAQVVTR